MLKEMFYEAVHAASEHLAQEQFSPSVRSVVGNALTQSNQLKEDSRVGHSMVYKDEDFVVPPYFKEHILKSAPYWVKTRILLGALQSLNAPEFWNDLFAIGDADIILMSHDDGFRRGIDGNIFTYGNQNFYGPYLVFLGAAMIFGSQTREMINPFWSKYFPPNAIAAGKIGNSFTLNVREPDDIRERMLGTFLPFEDDDCLAVQAIEKGQFGCPAPKLTATIFHEVGRYLLSDAGWELFASQVFKK